MNNPVAFTNPLKRAAIVHEFDEAIAELQSAKTFEDTLHILALQSRLLIGAHQSAISYVPDGDFKLGIHTHSFSDKYAKYNSYDVMPTGKGMWGLIVENRVPVRMTQEELRSHCRWKNFSGLKDARGLEHPPMKGWLAAPILRNNGDFLGVFQLSDKIDGEFTEHDLELFTHLTKLVAPTFELQYVNKELQQEVEERKQADSALRESEKRLFAIINTTVDAIITINERGAIETFNLSAEKLFGYSSSEAIGQNVKMLMPEFHRSKHNDYLKHHQKTGENRIIGIGRELVGERKDGTIFPMALAVSEVHLENQRIFTGIVRDLTERKQGEEALKKSNEELIVANRDLKETQIQLVQSAKLASIGQIAAGLAHEINQPLGVIRMRADLTKLILEREQDVDKDTVTESLNAINAEVVRASKIIKHLKTFSRQEKLSEHVETDINWLIDESFVLMNKTLQLEGIDVQKELTKGLPQVLCDYVQIEQVFTNLIGNAKDALQESTEKQLVVRSYRRDNNIFIDVEDTGPGIPKTVMEKVFDPFFTTKPVGQGTGLGLSISLGIIREHNGTLAVNSNKGERTCFTISLPITA